MSKVSSHRGRKARVPSHWRVLGLLSLSVPLLAGCAGQVAVRDVTKDKFGYLQSRFALSDAPTSAVNAIKAQDSGNLPFHRITLELTGHIEVGQTGNDPPPLHSTLTLINAGGPFVETLEELSSNGIPTRENYALRYRNLLSVREQVVPLNKQVTSWIFDIKTLTSFAPLAASSPGSGSFDEVYVTGNPIQIAALNHLSMHCTYGATYPAATLHAKLTGDAQDMNCEFTNANGVPSSHSVVVFLRQYGITYIRHNESASFTTNISIDDVRIEG